MKKNLKLLIELNATDWTQNMDAEEKDWFINDILLKGELILHSNEIGEEVGTVRVLKILNKE